MSTKLMENKDDWLNQEFFTKLAQNPRLMQAFTDPRYSAIIAEFGKNPQEAMKKYGHIPEFRQIMEDFSGLMGKHFDDVADKKKREAEEQEQKRQEEELRRQEELKNDPVMQTIESDPRVKEILADQKVQKVLEHLRFQGALDLYDLMKKDVETSKKLQYLIQRGVLNANSQRPGQ